MMFFSRRLNAFFGGLRNNSFQSGNFFLKYRPLSVALSKSFACFRQMAFRDLLHDGCHYSLS